jgi:hypothetical protein
MILCPITFDTRAARSKAGGACKNAVMGLRGQGQTSLTMRGTALLNRLQLFRNVGQFDSVATGAALPFARPEWSGYLDRYRIQHLWEYEACDYKFKTLVSLSHS